MRSRSHGNNIYEALSTSRLTSLGFVCTGHNQEHTLRLLPPSNVHQRHTYRGNMRSTSLIAACVCAGLAPPLAVALDIAGNAEVGVRPEAPTAPDIAFDCTFFVTVRDSSQDCRRTHTQSPLSSSAVKYLFSPHGLSLTRFWHPSFLLQNPSVKSDCSGLEVGNSYCVEVRRLKTSSSAAQIDKPGLA